MNCSMEAQLRQPVYESGILVCEMGLLFSLSILQNTNVWVWLHTHACVRGVQRARGTIGVETNVLCIGAVILTRSWISLSTFHRKASLISHLVQHCCADKYLLNTLMAVMLIGLTETDQTLWRTTSV